MSDATKPIPVANRNLRNAEKTFPDSCCQTFCRSCCIVAEASVLLMESSSVPKAVNGTGGSNVTSHAGGNKSHIRSMSSSSSSSRKLHSSAAATTNSNWNSASYFEALNVLSDETMSQACALVLHASDVDDVSDKNPSLSSSTANKDDTNAESSNAVTEIDPQEVQLSESALPSTTADDTAVKSSLEARQKELEQLQQLFSRCCQAAATFERESTLLQQQKQQQQKVGVSSTIPGAGPMARPKAPMGVVMNAAHRTSLIRNGSGRVPPGGGTSTLPIIATSSKGSMGAAISTITGVGGIHRRRPLEREKSDSSSATSASSSKVAGKASSSSYPKAATRNIGEDTGIHLKKIGKNGTEVAPPPPPNALQFLAMLNNDTSKKTTKTEATADIEPKRSGDTNSLGAISPPSAKRIKVSPPKMTPSNLPAELPPARIQPPRASRK